MSEDSLSQPGSQPEPPETEAASGPVLGNPPTPQQVEAAENLVRQARLAAMRGEKQKAGRLMREAAMAAPTSAPVQEALGDDAMERRAYQEAVEAYSRALLVTPGSVALERKHAEAILSKQLASDPFMAPTNDVGTYAKGKYAILLSVIFPGVGHIVAGKTELGIALLCVNLLATVAAVSLGGFRSFISLLTGGPDGTALGMVSFFFLSLVYLGCQFHMASIARQMETRKIERPKPPVDKPF